VVTVNFTSIHATAMYLKRLGTARGFVKLSHQLEYLNIALSHPCDRDVPTSCRQKKGADLCRAQTTKGGWRRCLSHQLKLQQPNY